MYKIIRRLMRAGYAYGFIEWIERRGNEDKSPEELWETCRNGAWLISFAAELGVDRRLVALAACDCARLALRFVPAGRNQPRLCLDAAEDYINGKIGLAEARGAVIPVRDYSCAMASNAACAAYVAVYTSRAMTDIGVTSLVDLTRFVEAVDATCDLYGETESSHPAFRAETEVKWRGGRALIPLLSENAKEEAQHECAHLVRARISWDIIESALELEEKK